MTLCYQACAKEGELPDVDESHRGPGVDAEDADAWEGGDHTGEEREEIGEGGHLGQENKKNKKLKKKKKKIQNNRKERKT